MTESAIQNLIRLALGRCRDLTLWRNNVGVADHGSHKTRYGLCRGSSDLIGILRPHGRFVALEVKTPTGAATQEQMQFLELIREQGGFAAIVRSPEEALQAIERARAGESC